MGVVLSTGGEQAQLFRCCVVYTYYGDLDCLKEAFHPVLNTLQISRATYIDLCESEITKIDAIDDLYERERKESALLDEKQEFFSAVENGDIVLGDTLLHVAARRGHEHVVDYLLTRDDSVYRKDTMAAKGSRVAAVPHPSLTTAQVLNLDGELPIDVAATAAIQLMLQHVKDVQNVLSLDACEEAKVHRLLRALRRIWPFWMVDGQPEVAAIVRVLYAARPSDPIFAKLTTVVQKATSSIRRAISGDGILIMATFLRDYQNDLHAVRNELSDPSKWSGKQLEHLCHRLFQRWLPHEGEERDMNGYYEEFISSAMNAWLQLLYDMRAQASPGTILKNSNLPGACTYEDILDEDNIQCMIEHQTVDRYSGQIWERRLHPPPTAVDEICSSIRALESHLHLSNLVV